MHNEGETSVLYHDDSDDFFGEYSDAPTGTSHSSVQPASGTLETSVSTPKSKDEDWDEWKDF
jgi:ADP-ribosylation factor GTPase-activating protein 1